MELTVFERANLLSILPREGNFKTLKTVRKLRESLALSEDEVRRWEPKVDDKGVMTWRTTTEDGTPIKQEAEIDISELGQEVILTVLKKLDGENRLKEDHFTLFEKFSGK